MHAAQPVVARECRDLLEHTRAKRVAGALRTVLGEHSDVRWYRQIVVHDYFWQLARTAARAQLAVAAVRVLEARVFVHTNAKCVAWLCTIELVALALQCAVARATVAVLVAPQQRRQAAAVV